MACTTSANCYAIVRKSFERVTVWFINNSPIAKKAFKSKYIWVVHNLLQVGKSTLSEARDFYRNPLSPYRHLNWPLSASVDELIYKLVTGIVDIFDRPGPDYFSLMEHGDAVGDFAG